MDDRAARLDALLARTGQTAQRIAAQQAERHANRDYAARIEMQAQAEAEPQAEAQGDVELELLRRGLSAFPDELVIRLSNRATACASLPDAWARFRPAKFATVNAKNRP